MDYYDFFGAEKQVVSQDKDNRMLLIRYMGTLVLIDEYSVLGSYKERARMRVTKEQIKKLNAMI